MIGAGLHQAWTRRLGHLGTTVPTHPWPTQGLLFLQHCNHHFLQEVFLEPPAALQAPSPCTPRCHGRWALCVPSAPLSPGNHWLSQRMTQLLM